MFTVTVRPGVVARLLLRVAAAVLRVADLAHEAVLGRPRVDERAEDSRERFVPRMAARGRRGLAVVANKVRVHPDLAPVAGDDARRIDARSARREQCRVVRKGLRGNGARVAVNRR